MFKLSLLTYTLPEKIKKIILFYLAYFRVGFRPRISSSVPYPHRYLSIIVCSPLYSSYSACNPIVKHWCFLFPTCAADGQPSSALPHLTSGDKVYQVLCSSSHFTWGSGLSCVMRVYRYCMRRCSDPDPHGSASFWEPGSGAASTPNKNQDPSPHQIENRIRIKVISRIRIRFKVMRIRNTGIRQRVWFGSHCSQRWNYWVGGRWIGEAFFCPRLWRGGLWGPNSYLMFLRSYLNKRRNLTAHFAVPTT